MSHSNPDLIDIKSNPNSTYHPSPTISLISDLLQSSRDILTNSTPTLMHPCTSSHSPQILAVQSWIHSQSPGNPPESWYVHEPPEPYLSAGTVELKVPSLGVHWTEGCVSKRYWTVLFGAEEYHTDQTNGTLEVKGWEKRKGPIEGDAEGVGDGGGGEERGLVDRLKMGRDSEEPLIKTYFDSGTSQTRNDGHDGSLASATASATSGQPEGQRIKDIRDWKVLFASNGATLTDQSGRSWKGWAAILTMTEVE